MLSVLDALEVAIAVNAGKRRATAALNVRVQFGLFERLLTPVADKGGHGIVGPGVRNPSDPVAVRKVKKLIYILLNGRSAHHAKVFTIIGIVTS